MQEKEISLKDMLFSAFRKWRRIIAFAIICAVLAGSYTAVTRAIDMNDAEKIEMWQTEYEIAKGSYWAAINDLDRQIDENERLASQAKLAIERLDIKKTEYEAKIEDLEAKIVYYEALIEDYKANIEELELEKEKLEYYLEYRREQNENSILMAIDPYNVNVYEVYLRVDSGYEILPGNTFQNQDPTPEIIQTYCLLVNNTEFYGKMITDLKLDTEVRYLTEVISIGSYNANSIRIRVISDDKDWSKKVGEYMAEAIKDSQSHVIASIADHDLMEYNANSYTVVDLNTYSKQYAFIQEEINYEASIRSVDMSMLRTEEDIREINTEIRYCNQLIEETQIAISELPLEKKSLDDEISGYHDANYKLKTERLELAKEPEPEYHGYTVVSVITGFIKLAIVGGVVGAFIAAVYYAIMSMVRWRVVSSEQVCGALNTKFFGYWPASYGRKLAFVDKWIARMSGREAKDITPETATKLVLSNVSVECEGLSSIMLCGGASKDAIEEVACAIAEQLPNVKVVSGTTIDKDPDVVRGVAECDAVILMEELDSSATSAAVQMKSQLQSMNKTLLGVILN